MEVFKRRSPTVSEVGIALDAALKNGEYSAILPSWLELVKGELQGLSSKDQVH